MLVGLTTRNRKSIMPMPTSRIRRRRRPRLRPLTHQTPIVDLSLMRTPVPMPLLRTPLITPRAIIHRRHPHMHPQRALQRPPSTPPARKAGNPAQPRRRIPHVLLELRELRHRDVACARYDERAHTRWLLGGVGPRGEVCELGGDGKFAAEEVMVCGDACRCGRLRA